MRLLHGALKTACWPRVSISWRSCPAVSAPG